MHVQDLAEELRAQIYSFTWNESLSQLFALFKPNFIMKIWSLNSIQLYNFVILFTYSIFVSAYIIFKTPTFIILFTFYFVFVSY